MIKRSLLSPLCIAPAFRLVREIFFRPFRLKTWLLFGIIVAIVGFEGGLPAKFRSFFEGMPEGRDAGGGPLHLAGLASSEVLGLLLVAVLVLLLAGGIALLVLWLRSLTRFAFVDAVVKRRVAIVRSYRENRQLAASFFGWCVCFGIAQVILLVPVAAGVIALVLAAEAAGEGALVGIIGSIVIIVLLLVVGIPLLIALGVVKVMAIDFVVPVMYLERKRVLDAWKRVLEVTRGHRGDTFLYLLLRFVMGVGFAVVSALVVVAVWAVGVALLVPLGVGVALAVREGEAAVAVTAVVAAALAVGPAIAGLFYASRCAVAPMVSFFRAWPMVFLGSCDESLAAVGRVRPTIRVEPVELVEPSVEAETGESACPEGA